MAATGVAATDAKFDSGLSDVAFDAAGNMLLSEYNGCRVWLVEAGTGLLRLVAGTGAFGSALKAGNPTNTQLDFLTCGQISVHCRSKQRLHSEGHACVNWRVADGPVVAAAYRCCCTP